MSADAFIAPCHNRVSISLNMRLVYNTMLEQSSPFLQLS